MADVARADTEDDLLSAVARYPESANAPDLLGMTALHYAAKRGFIGAVRRLVADRSAVDARDLEGETPLALAVRSMHLECAYELLLAGADPQSFNGPTRSTPLHVAAEVRALPIARLLHRMGAAVDATNRWGQTPLHVAAAQGWHGDAAVAEWLLDEGADDDARDDQGFSPMEIAAFRNNLPVLQLLEARGVSLDETTNRGSTLLDLALERNGDVVAQYLFERGSRAARTNDPVPPLHLAASRNDATLAASLLASGAAPSFTFHGETALEVAERAHHGGVAALLRATAAQGR